MDSALTGMNGALFVSITAFCIVIAILGLMALFMHALGWTVTRVNGIRVQKIKPGEAPLPTATDDIDDETVAAVTAAVTMMMGNDRFQVTSIRPAPDQSPGWIVSGPGNVPDSSDRWRIK